MLKYRPITIEPKQGGQLITKPSVAESALYNYQEKRDWRRDLMEEMRREGHDYFWPNTTAGTVNDFSTNPGNQPFPNNATIRPASGESAASLAVSTLSAAMTSSTGEPVVEGTTIATITFPDGHPFVLGETVRVSGCTETIFNGDWPVLIVTRTTIAYNIPSTGYTVATGTISVISAMPINLIHMARRPNGKNALIVGTACRLFRFQALENGYYFQFSGTTNGYFDPDDTYFDDNPGDWVIIANGFSPQGKRWEAVNLNGYAVFNNSVDLLHTYRVEDSEAFPIYELREIGVASVGTIAEFNGVLLCGDVRVIESAKLTALFQLVGITDAGDILASQSGTTVTTNAKAFTSADVGKWVVYESGEIHQITAYTSATQVTVSGSDTITDAKFTLRNKSSQAGSYFSGLITGTLNHTTMVVTCSSAPTLPTVGQILRFTNGFSSAITAVTDTTHFTLTPADDPGVDFTDGMPFYVIDESPGYEDFIVTATADIFMNDMVGRNITWDNGETRRILAYIDAKHVRVDSDLAISSEFFGVENPSTYGAYTDAAFVTRVQYRIMWSKNETPIRFSSSVPASISAGSNQLTFAYPAKSFEEGDEVVILGAGVNGGNLTATILYITGNKSAVIDTLAITDAPDSAVQRSDAIESIAGYDDLQDDGSGILKMGGLESTIVIYKDTSIFLGSYTGSATAPFQFRLRKVPNGKTLYYRHTLVAINTSFHVYAGRNAFYRFDLTNQIPQEIQPAELSKNLFFDQVRLVDTEKVFAADNFITKEIVTVFPSTSAHKAICYDYLQGTISTTSAAMTACGTVKKPETGLSQGETQDWFIMGTSSGVVLLYGRAAEPVSAWSSATEIYYRREANPFSAVKAGYDSVLQGGFTDFGAPYNEKDFEGYVIVASSNSVDVTLKVELLGGRNPKEQAVLSGFPYYMTLPNEENLVPLHLRQHFVSDRITIDGVDQPFRLTHRIWNVAGVNSQSFIRRAAA